MASAQESIEDILATIDTDKFFAANIKGGIEKAQATFAGVSLDGASSNPETAYGTMATAFLSGLGYNLEDPDAARSMMDSYLNSVIDGKLRVDTAIRKKDVAELFGIFKQAYEEGTRGLKLRNTLADVDSQPLSEQGQFDAMLAQLASVDGQNINPIIAGRNRGELVTQVLPNSYNTAKQYARTQ